MRDSFVLYTKIKDSLQELTLEQRGALLTAIIEYQCTDEVPKMDDVCVRLAFIPIKHDLDANNAAYETKCAKNRENGQKGGRPKKPNGFQNNHVVNSETQEKHNDNDNDNDNDIKRINNSHRFADEFDIIWSRYPRKQGKMNAFKSYVKARRSGVTFDDVSNGLDAYNAYIKANNTEQRYIKQGATWFNQQCWNDDYITKANITTADIAPMMDFSKFMV